MHKACGGGDFADGKAPEVTSWAFDGFAMGHVTPRSISTASSSFSPYIYGPQVQRPVQCTKPAEGAEGLFWPSSEEEEEEGKSVHFNRVLLLLSLLLLLLLLPCTVLILIFIIILVLLVIRAVQDPLAR